MTPTCPGWALRAGEAGDLTLVQRLLPQIDAYASWPESKALRKWARQQGWRVPFFFFRSGFIAQMLENEANFDRAIRHSGIRIKVPKAEHFFSASELADLDELYAERTSWNSLVEELREIRRAAEAGVVISVGADKPIKDWQSFYSWAHQRYPLLEEGADRWIGGDNS
jgi:hypothetical protein